VAVAWFATRNAPYNGGVIVGRKWLGDTLFADGFEGEDELQK
jgi:hypothetical protein